MISSRQLLTPVLLMLFVSSAALFAFADPPGRAVRIKYISGAVSMQPGGVDDWVAAVVNRPLTTSDRVWTDKEARAELHLGSAGLRMNAETSLTLTNVSDDIVQVELDQGTLNLHIRHLFGGETYEIDTPNQAFTILKAGDYRFDVDPNADTTSVTVWKGEGEANGQGPGVKLRSGHQATFTGGTSLEHQIASAPGFDGFDDWCRVRDDREDHAKSYEYVSADVVGADDLDDYGTWSVESSYGPVWVPAVAPGWSPYHNGHWVWVEPWGWTWVDDAPWGFAPCHYGRWVHLGGYWAWAPGPVVVARPVYAPALVAWVGGPHFGVSMSFGGGSGVAWFPLGWGEPYVPSYHVSRNYFQQVNVTNTRITNITNVTNNYYVSNNTTVVNTNIRNIRYANQNVAGAVTAVPTRALTNSEPVSRVAVAVPAGELRTASVANTAEVAPGKASVLGARADRSTAPPPSRVLASRSVFSHVAPPARPIAFEARQEALSRTPGRPLDAQTESQLRSNLARPAAPAAPAPAQPMQPVRPGSPMATSPSGIQPRPVPRPGGPQKFPGDSMDTDGKPTATTAQPVPQPMQPTRPGSPMATSPSAVQPRPVPRPGGPQRSSGVIDGEGSRPVMTIGQPTPPASPGRSVPRPQQASVPTPPADSSETTNAVRPGARPTPTSGTANIENPRAMPPPMARPGASTGVVRPSVDTVRPSAPRTAQPVSMPRSESPAQPSRSHAHTVVEAPRENPRHENKAKPSRHEEKAEPKQNR